MCWFCSNALKFFEHPFYNIRLVGHFWTIKNIFYNPHKAFYFLQFLHCKMGPKTSENDKNQYFGYNFWSDQYFDLNSFTMCWMLGTFPGDTPDGHGKGQFYGDHEWPKEPKSDTNGYFGIFWPFMVTIKLPVTMGIWCIPWKSTKNPSQSKRVEVIMLIWSKIIVKILIFVILACFLQHFTV